MGRQKAEEPPVSMPSPEARSLTLSQRPASLSLAAWIAPPPLLGQTAASPLPWPGGLWFLHEQPSLPAGKMVLFFIPWVSQDPLTNPLSGMHAEARVQEGVCLTTRARGPKRAMLRNSTQPQGLGVCRGCYLPQVSSLFPGTLLY